MCVVNTAECLSQAENGQQQLHVAYGICSSEYSPLSLWEIHRQLLLNEQQLYAVGPHNAPHLTQLLNGAEVKCLSTPPIKTILSEAMKLQIAITTWYCIAVSG